MAQEELFVVAADLVSLGDRVEALARQTQELYRQYGRPWVVGFSGGKDSTAATQLLWRALESLPEDERGNPVFVVAGDTLVEDPAMVARLQQSVAKINAAAQARHMPFSAHIVRPPLTSRYFVKLIGKGYPAPTTHFRWCTERLKIDPATRFIEERASKYGEVVVVLGAREQESTTRAQVMAAYEIPGQVMRRHSTIPGAYVYAPIAQWSTQDVWQYLLAVPSPWGDVNRNLAALYKQSEGECPLVIDRSTPTCGGGRFGCWVCTVSGHNRSLEARFDEGEDWLEPLLEFRELLVRTIDPQHKLEYRGGRGRNDNRVLLTRKGEVSPRSYSLETRKMLLRRLLEAQVRVQREGPDPTLELIGLDELQEIRRIWRHEDGDWEDSLPGIYREVVGSGADNLWVSDDDGAGWGAREKDLLAQLCEEQGVPLDLILQLLEAERRCSGMTARAGIQKELQRILAKDWRDPGAVVAELQAERAAVLEKAASARPRQLEMW